MEQLIENLQKKADEIRLNIVRMVGPNKPGHFGGACSLAEIISVLYFHKMVHDPQNSHWEERDRLILSKGHAGIAQYAALAMCGYFPMDELRQLKTLGAALQGHPDMRKIPGIEANTGSLGQGLSIACGVAAGAKIDCKKYRVYCVVGDGELAEGQIWEAAMSAAFYKLDNLTAILDKNNLQATGPISQRFNTNPVVEKWAAFGWHTIELDGHDIPQIIKAFEEAGNVKGKPVILIANTIKGKGIPFAENNAAFHNGTMTSEQYETICKELSQKLTG